MARDKKPFYKCFPIDYLTDSNIKTMSLEVRGALHTLFQWAWVNKVRRGHLLQDKKTPIPEVKIAKDLLGVSLKKWCSIRDELLDKKKMRSGRKDQFYFPWIINYKSDYELYQKEPKAEQKKSANKVKTTKK